LKKLLLAAAFVLIGTPVVAAAPAQLRLKPQRVLLVSGTQIQDSYVIDRDADAERSDVAAIAALFKLWGVPFDVLRLDVHSMTLEDFVDAAGNARYGAIVWAARQDQYPWQLQDYGLLTQAVATKGESLLAVGDRIREPAIQQLLGITYLDTGNTCDTVVLSGPSQSHFVIRGLEGTRTALGPFQFARVRVSVDPGARVTTLADACGLPQLTVRTVDAASRTRAVWLGGGLNVFDENPTFIKLLQRALVWAVGYGVYKEYGNAVLLRMDDPGCATSAYFKCGSPPWYFAPLSAADWNTRVLQPLRSYKRRRQTASISTSATTPCMRATLVRTPPPGLCTSATSCARTSAPRERSMW
jgi:hypothetical protein